MSRRRGSVSASAPVAARAPARRVVPRKVWLSEQETAYSCGPASLKYALCIFGFSPREEQLRRLAHTTWRGTQTTKLIAAARRFGLTTKLRVFFEEEFDTAWAWLQAELEAGHVVILDVEGFAHYVVAVQAIHDQIVIIDPEGATMNGSDYAEVVLASARKLRPWWLSGDEEGEPRAFRGIVLEMQPPSPEPRRGVPRPTRPRLRFSAALLRRHLLGRPWVIDEYLIDVVDMAAGVHSCQGEHVALGELVRTLGEEGLAGRAAFWHEARAAEVQMAKAHVEDIALAAEAMELQVPSGPLARQRIAVDVTALLTAMLHARG